MRLPIKPLRQFLTSQSLIMNRMSITRERANVYPMCTKMRVWFTNRHPDSHLQTCLTATRTISFGDDRRPFDTRSLRFCKCSEWTEGGTHGPPAPYLMYWTWRLPAGSDGSFGKDFRGRKDKRYIPFFIYVWEQWFATRGLDQACRWNPERKASSAITPPESVDNFVGGPLA